MHPGRICRPSAFVALLFGVAGLSVVQACERGGSGTAGASAGVGAAPVPRDGSSYEACASGKQEAPPAGFLKADHEKESVDYAKSTLHYIDDNIHLSSQIVLVAPGPVSHPTYMGVASIQPEHCSHKLQVSDFDGGRVVSKITSSVDYNQSNHLHFLKGTNYVVAYHHGGEWGITVYHLDGTDTAPTLTRVDTAKIDEPPKSSGYVIPAATFRYDTVDTGRGYELVLSDNSQCGDQCCGFGGGSRGQGQGGGHKP